jgi:hypothetical protein
LVVLGLRLADTVGYGEDQPAVNVMAGKIDLALSQSIPHPQFQLDLLLISLNSTEIY